MASFELLKYGRKLAAGSWIIQNTQFLAKFWEKEVSWKWEDKIQHFSHCHPATTVDFQAEEIEEILAEIDEEQMAGSYFF